MKTTAATLCALSLCATSVHAAGLDRSFQDVTSIFGDNGASLSFGYVNPRVTGTDALGNSYDVGDSYSRIGATYTRELTDKFTIGVILDQPFGANVTYNSDPTSSTLGGTGADLSSEALTIIGKYKIADRFSVYGGIKAQQVRAEVQLNGTAYRNPVPVSIVAGTNDNITSAVLGGALFALRNPGVNPEADLALAALGGAAVVAAPGGLAAQVTGLQTDFDAGGSGYNFKMDPDPNVGFLIGAAYEIPDIALRFSATYHFEIDNTSDTIETIGTTPTPGTVDYKTPQSLNLNFQTGIAPNTLLTASYRWTDFSEVDVIPDLLQSDLVNLDDGHRYTLGIARRFNENLVGSVSISYEPKGDDDLVSPLGPTDGLWGISIGGRYSTDNMNISGGINYSKLGDARPEVGGAAVANFEGNSSLAIGFKAEFLF